MERLKRIKEALLSCVEGQLGDLKNVDAEELGEAIDMIKDMEEAMYYHSVVKAMEEQKQDAEAMEKYGKYYMQQAMQMSDNKMMSYQRDMDKEYGRAYYPDNNSSQSNRGSRNRGDRDNNSDNYEYSGGEDILYSGRNATLGMRDSREGRSPISRRNYMESKEMHHDTPVKMKELEKYMYELSQDISEMIDGASQEEKAMLQQKLTTLANKIK